MKIDSQKVINFLNERWKGVLCPYCHGNEWNVQDKVFEVREFNNGDMYVGGPNAAIVPIIPVTCSKCGHTVLVNALIAGVVEDK